MHEPDVTAEQCCRIRDTLGPDHPLTSLTFDARLNTVSAAEARNPAPPGTLWWLSFVDPDRAALRDQQQPGGPGFLGVVIVEALGPVHATNRATALGINPGGEVAPYPLPTAANINIPDRYRNRLLTRHDIAQLHEPS